MRKLREFSFLALRLCAVHGKTGNAPLQVLVTYSASGATPGILSDIKCDRYPLSNSEKD
ncbi:MAG: hypothetical protein NWQ28_05930 [Nodularia sp. (in: cyanobacteria)]|nr:hypothetical protein [Nodularia sp. (in: cyanobacteria)]